MNVSRNAARILSVVTTVSLLIAASVGVFSHGTHIPRTARNLYGDQVELFGRGIYAKESLFQGPIFVGTDVAVLIFLIPLLGYLLFLHRKRTLAWDLVTIGLVTTALYYSLSLAFGTTMNRLFLVYIAAAGSSAFLLAQLLLKLDVGAIQERLSPRPVPTSLVVFMMIAGLSTFVWFFEIAEFFIQGRPSEIIGMKTTEPTFVLDLALVAPLCFSAAFLLGRKRARGIVCASMMLTLLLYVGLIVIGQTLAQRYYGIEVPLRELIVYVFSFVVLSLFAVAFLRKTLKLTN